jgi:hypothetical protein
MTRSRTLYLELGWDRLSIPFGVLLFFHLPCEHSVLPFQFPLANERASDPHYPQHEPEKVNNLA